MVRCLLILMAVFISFCSYGLYSLGYAEAAAGPLLQPYVDMMNNKLYTLDILHVTEMNGQKYNMHNVYVVSGDRVYEKNITTLNNTEMAHEMLYIGDRRYDLSGYSRMEKGKRKFHGNQVGYIKGMYFSFAQSNIYYLLGGLFQENKLAYCKVYSGSGQEDIRGKILQYEDYVPENDMGNQKSRYYFDQGQLVACVVLQNFEYEGKKLSNRDVITFKQFVPAVDESLLTIPEGVKQIEQESVGMDEIQVGMEGSISYD